MTWAAFAALAVGSRPVYLYKLEKDGAVAYYTSRNTSYSAAPATMSIDFFDPDNFFGLIDVFAATFSERPISHTVIRSTSNSNKKKVTVTLPRTDAFAQRFIGPLGISTTKVSIWQGFENDTVDKEFVRIFLGEVQLVKPMLGTTSLVCEDANSSTKAKGLAAVIQRPCRHALYHTGCGLSLTSYQTTASATAIAGSVLTATEAASQPDGYYSGGIISYGGSLQLITAHTGSALTLLGAVGTLAEDIAASGTQIVEIAAGCNRSISDCETKFSNSNNFGGFPNLTNSPFDGRSMT